MGSSGSSRSGCSTRGATTSAHPVPDPADNEDGGPPMGLVALVTVLWLLMLPVKATADLVPLPIRPVSVSITAGGTTATGTTTATALGPFSDANGNIGAIS